MRHKKVLIIVIALTILAFVSSIVFFNLSHNAAFTDLSSYICENHSIVKAIDFDSCRFYCHPWSNLTVYVYSSCTSEQAKDIFEDFVNHFSDELIQWLHNEMKGKDFLDVAFTNAETNQRIYYFETGDTENFVHWEVGVSAEDLEPYTFDRELD